MCVAWSEADPPLDEVSQLLSAIDMEIDIAKLFSETLKGKTYKIRGLICYYLKHYAAYFFNDKENVWFSFDDVSVQEGLFFVRLFCFFSSSLEISGSFVGRCDSKVSKRAPKTSSYLLRGSLRTKNQVFILF